MLTGKTTEGKIISIDEITPEEEIRCPECNEVLIQKRGDIRIHHFAHKSNNTCPRSQGMTLAHMMIQRYVKRFFEDAYCYESQLEKTITSEWGTVRPDYYVKYKHPVSSREVELCVEVVETNTNPAHFDEKSVIYRKLGMQVLWVFDEDNLAKKVRENFIWNDEIKLNEMQEEIMRDTGQIVSVSGKYVDGWYVRKLYFPRGQWRKQTCSIYSTKFIAAVEELIVLRGMWGWPVILKDNLKDVTEMVNKYYVWWNEDPDGEDCIQNEQYSNTYTRTKVRGIVAKDYTQANYDDEEKSQTKLYVYDPGRCKMAVIPKNRVYIGLKLHDDVVITTKGGGMVSVERNGEPYYYSNGNSNGAGETSTGSNDIVDVDELLSQFQETPAQPVGDESEDNEGQLTLDLEADIVFPTSSDEEEDEEEKEKEEYVPIFDTLREDINWTEHYIDSLKSENPIVKQKCAEILKELYEDYGRIKYQEDVL